MHGDDRVKYDYLFGPGDPENKRFWQEWHKENLANSFIFLGDK